MKYDTQKCMNKKPKCDKRILFEIIKFVRDSQIDDHE